MSLRKKSSLVRRIGETLSCLVLALCLAWSALALYFDFPAAGFGMMAAAIFLLIVAFFLWYFRRPRMRVMACILCFCCVLAWWLTLKPSNDGPWQEDVSRTAWAEVQGNQVVIHDFRSCDYQTEHGYTCQWLTRTVDVNRIAGLDLFMDYWTTPWIAHTILSFDLQDGKHIAFSIEARKRPGQDYSAIRGFFRQFTLITVVSDERDVVRLRSNFRDGEDLYLFHTKATPEFARRLFLSYIQFTNQMHDHPEWYNAITHNCTTEIYALSVMNSQPWDIRILLNGKADQMEYERGQIAGDLPWPELKQKAYINPAARAANDDPEFSTRIRENRPGFTAAGGR